MLSSKVVMLLLSAAVVNRGAHHHLHRASRRSHLAHILQSNNKFFSELTRNSQKAVNGIFESLQLSELFSKEQKIEALLKMLQNLKAVSQEYFNLYDVLRNASNVDFSNMPLNQKRLNDLIIRLLNEKERNVDEKTEGDSSESAQSLHTNKNSSSEFGDSKEFKEFIRGFMTKLKIINEDDLFHEKEIQRFGNEFHLSRRRNLDVNTVVNYEARHHKLLHWSEVAHNPQLNDNFFAELTKNYEKVVNGIFELLQLSYLFSEEPKIQAILKMFYNLNVVSQQYFELYDRMRNASNVDFDNMPVNRKRLNKFLLKILTEKKLDISNKTEIESSEIAQSLFTNKNSSSEFANSKELKDFIDGFITKLKRLNVDDLFYKKEILYFDSETGQRNLDVWEPPLKEETDISHMKNRRIFGGKKTNIGTYSFVASIHIDNKFTCAGSVISKDLIITSASCLQNHYNSKFFKQNPKNTYVRVGSDWTFRRGELIPVQEIYFYPQYEPNTLRHNIAIMRLKRTLYFHAHNKTRIRRIMVDHQDEYLLTKFDSITILGWGAKKPNQITNEFEKLNYATLNIYEIEECKKIYSRQYVTENHFCGGFITKGNGACNRDVGAPGVIRSLLVGIVSFGSPVCGMPDAPTVFTRVGHYIKWIELIMTSYTTEHGFLTTSSRLKTFFRDPSPAKPQNSSLYDLPWRAK